MVEIVIQTKGLTRLVMFVLSAHFILQVFRLWNLLNVFWEVWAHKTSLTPSLFIEVPVPRKLGVSI